MKIKRQWHHISLILLIVLNTEIIFTISLVAKPEILKNSIQYISGKRCLILKSRNPLTKTPPLIIIGGMAQSITSWEHHFSGMQRNRDVLIYECPGQGPPQQQATNNLDDTEDIFENVSLPIQACAFFSVINLAFPDVPCVDVAGFSFGGRVAMATAAYSTAEPSSSFRPVVIRKLHLTGVPAERDAYARHILSSWKDILTQAKTYNDAISNKYSSSSSLRCFAWSSLLATHSPEFLSTVNERRMEQWVNHICRGNTVDGLLAIVTQTHTEDVNDEWHPLSMASRIRQSQSITEGRLVVGSKDKLASVEEVMRLGDILNWGDDCVDVYDGCGHAVVIEQARQWRNDLLQFLDD